MEVSEPPVPELSTTELPPMARGERAERGDRRQWRRIERTEMIQSDGSAGRRDCSLMVLASIAWAVPVGLLAVLALLLAAILGHVPEPNALSAMQRLGAGDVVLVNSSVVSVSALESPITTGSSDFGGFINASAKGLGRNASLPNATVLLQQQNQATLDALDDLVADDPFAGYSKLSNASASFFTGWFNASSGKLQLEVADSAIGTTEFVVGVLASRADGTAYVLHEPLSETEGSTYRLELSPNGVDLDLVRPQLLLRPRPGGTVNGSLYTDGAWTGWVRTFKAAYITTWVRTDGAAGDSADPGSDDDGHVDTYDSADVEAASGGQAPVNASEAHCPLGAAQTLRLEGKVAPWLRVPSETRAAVSKCGYVRNGSSWLFDATEWVLGGSLMGEGGPKLHGARLSSVRGFVRNLDLQVQAHVPVPDDTKGVDAPISLELQISFAQLPELDGSFVARAADDRVGFWNLAYTELGAAGSGESLSARRTDRKVNVVQRWRLEKADANAALSVPVKPITYHIDPSVPERWWPAVKRGVENWNAAFESAGFVDAIRAVLPTDADFPADYSAGDLRYSSISWAISTKSVYAVGPHTFDPRTGEILDADIMFADGWVDYWVSEHEQEAPSGWAAGTSGAGTRGAGPSGGGTRGSGFGGGGGGGADVGGDVSGNGVSGERLAADLSRAERQMQRAQHHVHTLLGEAAHGSGIGAHTHTHSHSHSGPCGRSQHAALAETMRTAALLGLGGNGGDGTDGDGGVPVFFVEQAMTEVVMHEVGHTLGLRHNFKGSAAYTFDELADADFRRAHGTGSSVMDYSPTYWGNVSATDVSASGRGSSESAVFFSTVVGAYDKWAIEYGYTPLSNEQPGTQHPALAEIASRGASSRELAFGTDEDEPRSDGTDPLTNLYDLSADPLAFYEAELRLAHTLLASAVNRSVRTGESWWRLSSAVRGFMKKALRSGVYAAKYIGGNVMSKAHRGDGDGGGGGGGVIASPVLPVSAAEQARALRVALRVLSQDFWLPAAAAARHLVVRTGACTGLDQYCLGLKAMRPLRDAVHTRKLVLMQLLQPLRLDGLEQHEWAAAAGDEGLHGGAGGRGESGARDAAGTAHVDTGSYSLPPLEPALRSALTIAESGGPSVSSLLRAVHASLALPSNTSALLVEPPTDAKMRYEMQRVWVSILADMTSSGLDEPAAVASGLLFRLKEEFSQQLQRLPSQSNYGAAGGNPNAVDAFEDHLFATVRMLELWVKGVELPPALPE